MEGKEKDKKLKINSANMPVDSSLGLLAIGDVAFVEWRKAKVAHNVMNGAIIKDENNG